MAIIFRFVDKGNNIRKEFVSFLDNSYGLSSQSLCSTIKEFLVLVAIDTSGISPCFCHSLNLAVVASYGEQSVRKLMTNIKNTWYFFNLSVPCKNCLEDKILLYCPESLKINLKISADG